MDLKYLQPNETQSVYFMHGNKPAVIVYLSMVSFATLWGTVGNIMVIGAVLVDKTLRTVGNIFILNLAIADICVTSFVNPFSIIGIVLGEPWFANKPALCEFIASICLTSCFCSLLSIGAIGFNRYVHICHHRMYERIFDLQKTVLMCVGLWCVSFLAESPNFMGWGDHVYDRKTLSCVWDRTASFSYTIFFSSVGVAFPVVVISICYLQIFLHVRASKRKILQMSSVDSSSYRNGKDFKSNNKEYIKLVRTLFLVFVVFAVCWSPYAVIVVADRYDTYPREAHLFSIVVAHTNSSLNCVLYGITNRNFRRGYKKIVGLDWIMNKCGTRRVRVTPFFISSRMEQSVISPSTGQTTVSASK